MKESIKYIADDGTEFDTKQACRSYEAACSEAESAARYFEAHGVSGRKVTEIRRLVKRWALVRAEEHNSPIEMVA